MEIIYTPDEHIKIDANCVIIDYSDASVRFINIPDSVRADPEEYLKEHFRMKHSECYYMVALKGRLNVELPESARNDLLRLTSHYVDECADKWNGGIPVHNPELEHDEYDKFDEFMGDTWAEDTMNGTIQNLYQCIEGAVEEEVINRKKNNTNK